MGDVQSLIDTIWNFNEPASSEARFREVCDSAHDHVARLQLRTQIARALGLQHKFHEGHLLLDAVEREFAQSPDDSRSAASRVRCLLERGRLFNSAGERDRALPLFGQALHAAREIGNDHLAIDAAHMIAIVHGAEQGHDLALDWNRIALQMAEGSSQPRARQWRGSLHNNIGWSYHDRGEFERALIHFECAMQARVDDHGKLNDIRIARWCIGRCLRSLKRFNDALRLQRELEAERIDAGVDEDGFVSEEIAECLLALDRPVEAGLHFAKAFGLLSKLAWLASEQPARLARLMQLAR